MLSEYIQAAMNRARYELTEDGRFFGSIPKCDGAWAETATLEECREELRQTLEAWLVLGLRLNHRLPVLDGISLNRRAARPAKREAAHA